jgi:hypothetical protein
MSRIKPKPEALYGKGFQVNYTDKLKSWIND